MNSRETLAAVADWLGWQDEDLSAKLRNAFDALRLWDYAQKFSDLPEMADEWDVPSLVAAIGYNPWEQEYSDAKLSGASDAARAIKGATKLLDSVAFVAVEGDTTKILKELEEIVKP